MFNSYSLHGLRKYFISLFETLNSFFTNSFEPWQSIGLGSARELSSSQTVLYHSKVLSHKQKPNSRARALCLLLVTMILVCSYRRATAPLLPLSHLPKSSCSYLSSHSPFAHLSRLRQSLKPHPPQSQPIGRGGSAGPPPAGGACPWHAHVAVEGGHRAGLAGGRHGDAHVHSRLLRECEEWQGMIRDDVKL